MTKWVLHILVLATLFILACTTNENHDHNGIVSVSILPQKYFTRKIAGEKYRINVLIPPGASPASYEPVPRQIEELEKSDLYLRIGKIGFEKAWIEKLQKSNPQVPFIDLSEGIEFIRDEHDHTTHDQGGEDPHIWMSAVNARQISENIYLGLSSVFPSDSQLFYRNYKELLLEIDRIDSLYRRNHDQLRNKNFLVYHPALGYLARDYGMVQHVLELEGKEPPPSHIAEIIKQARENRIQYIFIQSQFNTDNARSLAREIDAEVVLINPLNENWKAEMIEILKNLLK